MKFIVPIIALTEVTHNVRCIRIKKPEGYNFVPGQATEVSVNKPGWEKEKRPFTFTCLNEDPYLEFTIKCYTDHDGVTNQVRHLEIGDELIIRDAWGAIEYKGEGYFIAGGAGITPFIAILRRLHVDNKIAGNKLFFSNKTDQDIIYAHELHEMLGDNAIYTVTDGNDANHLHERIDSTFLEKRVDDFSKHFYVCGPDPMIAAIREILEGHGASPDAVVFEK
ncbi:FAD-binding oxidoreductase [Polluticoccus soli]|uniref:FAD-binding oxidoreductase n=1 Tax=Polluticoccus soli TaxID=3034150 RepID=UPI0023E0E4F2|nr:FAD-binding oxidoreductase [Flavipsychrobacter sp. JY13-12]